MKTRIPGLMALLFVAATMQTITAQKIQVEAVNNDISYYLDLKAIATIFGDSRDLEEFERKINDFDSQISNLDLNSDGDVDYLRVIETSENNTHLVVIQAILDKDVFQDVATVVVERDRYRRSYVQIIGDPYIYGSNYIIEPVYYNTPYIVSWFWTPRYHSWYSPYSWGYYPRYYHYRRPMHIDIYLSHIHGCINYSHNYRYNDSWRSHSAYNMYNSVRRNDYSVRYPDRSYSRRNTDVTNRYEMDKKRNSDYARMSERSATDNNRYGSRTSANDNVYNRSGRQSTDTRNAYGSRTETRTSEAIRNSGEAARTRENNTESYRGRSSESNNRESQSRNTYNNDTDNRRNTTTRSSETSRPEVRKNESNDNRTTRSSSETVRPSRSSSENKSVERSSSNTRSSAPSASRSESSRSSKSDSGSSRGRR
jgi:hypothetical protein